MGSCGIRHLARCIVLVIVIQLALLLLFVSNNKTMTQLEDAAPKKKSEEVRIRDLQAFEESQKARPNISNFKFSRQELRLQFKEIPFVPEDIFFDNKDMFSCLHNGPSDEGSAENLWCRPRPLFATDMKNPCFFTTPRLDDLERKPRCIPYFHILGTDKCGTTDFHARLVRHPHIIKNDGNMGKETYFWCWLRYGLWMSTTIPRWYFFNYVGMFFTTTSKEIVAEYTMTGNQLITGDATPMDLWDFRGWPNDPQNAGLDEPAALTPHAMRHMYKNPRFFVLMRNPVDRLYSDYLAIGIHYKVQRTTEGFARDVRIAISLMRDCLKLNSTRKCFFSDVMYHKMPVRLHIGCYSVFLREWLSVFNRRHFFFLRTEDWHTNMTQNLERAFQFLEVDPLTEEMMEDITSSEIPNPTFTKAELGDMHPETRALLTEFYSPFNDDLAKLLGDDHYLWR